MAVGGGGVLTRHSPRTQVKGVVEEAKAAAAAAESAAAEASRFVSGGHGEEWYTESAALVQKVLAQSSRRDLV